MINIIVHLLASITELLFVLGCSLFEFEPHELLGVAACLSPLLAASLTCGYVLTPGALGQGCWGAKFSFYFVLSLK